MKKFEVEVRKRMGKCAHAYKCGDKFVFNELDTPDGFCGRAYTALFPFLFALNYGAQFKDGDNTKISCPDDGDIVFSVKLMDEIES